jgi:hypothetical protein
MEQKRRRAVPSCLGVGSGGGGLFSFLLFKFKVPDWGDKVNQESKYISQLGTIILTIAVLQQFQGGVVSFWGAHGGIMGAPMYSISNGT